jgi:hypothetical protein
MLSFPCVCRALHHHQQLSKSKKEKKDKIKNGTDGRRVGMGIFPILIRYTGISIRNLKRGRRVA